MNDFNPLLLVCGIFCMWPLLVGALPTFLIMKYRPRVSFTLGDEDDAPSLEGYGRAVPPPSRQSAAAQNPPRRSL